jgi:hypothetical protein
MEQEIPLKIQNKLFQTAARTATWARDVRVENHLRSSCGYCMSFGKDWPYSYYKKLFFQDGFLQGHRLQFIQAIMKEAHGWVTTFNIKHTKDSVFIYLVFQDRCLRK